MGKQIMTSETEDLDIETVMSSMEDLDEVIDDSVEASAEEDIVEEDEDDADETPVNLAPDEESGLESALETLEIYETAAAVANAESKAEAAPEPEPKQKKERKPPAPRGARSINDLDASVFVLTTEEVSDQAANKAAVIARRPSQVKVAEKFDNLLLSLAASKAPNSYTMKAFKIVDAEKSISSADLTKKLVDGGMALSTARSQAGQIMSLFPALQIAKRSGKLLTMNEDSILAEALRLL